MINVFLVLGQSICVIGLIYAALLATVSIDWLEDLPTDSLKADAVGPCDSCSACASEPDKHAANPARVL